MIAVARSLVGAGVAAAALAVLATTACATIARPQTPAEEPVGTRDGARARALIYAHARGFVAGDVDVAPYSATSLLTEAQLPSPSSPTAQTQVAAAAAASMCGPLTIDVEDRLTDGALFRLTSFTVFLDGVRIVAADDVDADRARRYLAFEGAVAAGAHDIVGRIVIKGAGDARAYTWKLRDRSAITCAAGESRHVVVAAVVQQAPAEPPKWEDAPRIAFSGDVDAGAIAAPRTLVVDNQLAASLTAYREAVRTGLAPSIDVARVDAVLALTSPFVAHAITDNERAFLDAIRATAPAAAADDVCALRIKLTDLVSDSVPDPFALSAAHVELDGNAILDTTSPPPQAGLDALLFDGPVKHGKHRVVAVLQFRRGAAHANADPIAATAAAAAAVVTGPTDVVTVTGGRDFDCANADGAAVTVAVHALRCIDRDAHAHTHHAGLRFTVDNRFDRDDCETF